MKLAAVRLRGQGIQPKANKKPFRISSSLEGRFSREQVTGGQQAEIGGMQGLEF